MKPKSLVIVAIQPAKNNGEVPLCPPGQKISERIYDIYPRLSHLCIAYFEICCLVPNVL